MSNTRCQRNKKNDFQYNTNQVMSYSTKKRSFFDEKWEEIIFGGFDIFFIFIFYSFQFVLPLFLFYFFCVCLTISYVLYAFFSIHALLSDCISQYLIFNLMYIFNFIHINQIYFVLLIFFY